MFNLKLRTMSHNLVLRLLFVSLSFAALGCASSTSPNASSSPTGTILFGNTSRVEDAVLGSNTSSILFTGYDPAYTSAGLLIYAVPGLSTSNGTEHIVMSGADGANPQLLVDLKANVDLVQSHPKMSPDGKYVSFNYSSDALQLGTHNGTLIYSSSGAALGYIENAWDASWVPDGSLVLSGSVLPHNGIRWTPQAPGLFKVDKNFTGSTPIGTGLTIPQYPSVSPDGTKVAFAMTGHIWVIGMDGTGLKQVTTGPNSETYSAWSPDGTQLAVISYGTIGLDAGNAMAIVSSNPSTPTTVSASASVWVQDKNNGLINPQGNVDWKR